MHVNGQIMSNTVKEGLSSMIVIITVFLQDLNIIAQVAGL